MEGFLERLNKFLIKFKDRANIKADYSFPKCQLLMCKLKEH